MTNEFCDVCGCTPCDCEWYEDDSTQDYPVEETKVTYEYIYDEAKGFYYVPRPNSKCAGQVRNMLFQKHFGEMPLIVSPEVWQLLLKSHKVRRLSEE